jgi:phospholipid/cholesterol/gamma-HCH transport system substrate-binding protein
MQRAHLRFKVFGLVAFTFVCLAMFLYLYVAAGGRLRIEQPYNAKALVPDSFNIVPNSDIRLQGVKIGRVRTVEPQGQISVVDFEIEKEDHQQLYRDATVRVRTKTLVGESYLEVNPGSEKSGKLESGAALPLEAAEEAVPLERILSTFDPETRQEIRRNMEGLGEGLDGKGGDLNKTFGAMKPAVASGGRLMDVLEPQKRELAALVDNTGEVLEAFGERDAAFRGLVVDAKRTAEVVAERDERFRESIAELPATLDRARSSVATLASFSTRATPTVRDLKTASIDLAPAIRDLEPSARTARTFFDELEPFLDRVDPLLDELKPATESLATMIRPLDAFLRQVNPTVDYLKDYNKEFSSFFSNVGATVSGKDVLGHKARVFALVGPNQFTNLPKPALDALEALVEAGGAQGLYNIQKNSFPKPGTVGAEKPFDGEYERVEEQK